MLGSIRSPQLPAFAGGPVSRNRFRVWLRAACSVSSSSSFAAQATQSRTMSLLSHSALVHRSLARSPALYSRALSTSRMLLAPQPTPKLHTSEETSSYQHHFRGALLLSLAPFAPWLISSSSSFLRAPHLPTDLVAPACLDPPPCSLPPLTDAYQTQPKRPPPSSATTATVGPAPASETDASDRLSPYLMAYPVYSREELDAIKVVHHEPKTMGDRVARWLVTTARWGFDTISGYKVRSCPCCTTDAARSVWHGLMTTACSTPTRPLHARRRRRMARASSRSTSCASRATSWRRKTGCSGSCSLNRACLLLSPGLPKRARR